MRLLDPPFIPWVEYANWKSDLVESAAFSGFLGFCRFDSCLDHLAQNDRMVQRLRRLHDTQEIEGSIPSAITGDKWFVSVPAARVLGKNEDRVRFSNEPLH